jgi:hypothetical protein
VQEQGLICVVCIKALPASTTRDPELGNNHQWRFCSAGTTDCITWSLLLIIGRPLPVHRRLEVVS